jgi:hypothetical protein
MASYPPGTVITWDDNGYKTGRGQILYASGVGYIVNNFDTGSMTEYVGSALITSATVGETPGAIGGVPVPGQSSAWVTIPKQKPPVPTSTVANTATADIPIWSIGGFKIPIPGRKPAVPGADDGGSGLWWWVAVAAVIGAAAYY